MLYVLNALGVRLFLWTNRSPEHKYVTMKSFGKHWALFDDAFFHSGTKILASVPGPIMDNEEKYMLCSKYDGLVVRTL